MASPIDRIFRRFLKDAGITTLAGGINAVLGLVRAWCLTRYLGVLGFGYYSVAQSTGSVVRSLLGVRVWEWVTWGLSHAEAQKNAALAGAYIRAGYLLNILVYGGSALVLLFGAGPIAEHILAEPELASPIRATTVLIAAPWMNETSQAILRISRRFVTLAVYNVGSTLAQLATILGCWFVDATLETMLIGAGLAQLFVSSILLVAGTRAARSHFGDDLPSSLAPVWTERRKHAATLLSMSATSTLKTLGEEADVLLLSRIGGAEAAGMYRVVRNLLLSIFRLATPAYMALVPEITKAAAKLQVDIVLGLMKRVSAIGFGIGIATTVVLGFGSELIVHNLFGPEFSDAAPLLMVMAPAAFFFTTVWSTPLYIAVDRAWWTTLRAVAVLLIRMGGIYVLFPHTSLIGAAYAFLGSYAMMVVYEVPVGWFAVRRLRSKATQG